jgi:lysozyme
VEAHYGKPVLLYLTEEFDSAYRVSARVKRTLWLRSLVTEPSFGARPWHIWQASNFRRLDGIEGRVDWNAMR